MSTPSELAEIAERVLAWVASSRRLGLGEWDIDRDVGAPTPNDLRRIELCALATQEMALLQTMYPSDQWPTLPQEC